jgi:ubiquinone/menaquinone biosynthesis C-methylase UbiE
MVGPTGRVVCLDVQPRMLSVLDRRARRRNLEQIIETRACTQHDLGTEDLVGAVDLTLAVHVVHESAYPRRFLSQIRDVLCPGGQLVVIEPKGHVSPSEFEATRGLCREIGLVERGMEWFRSSHAMRLEKPRVDGGRGGVESGGVATD